MIKRREATHRYEPFRWQRGTKVPMSVIRRFAREVAEQFDPLKIILFGSYAYGRPHRDSDVDILVVMPAYDEINQCVRIRKKTYHPFPLDLIVRKPETLRWRLDEGDWFLREIVSKGKVLYEKTDLLLGSKGGRRLARTANARKRRPART